MGWVAADWVYMHSYIITQHVGGTGAYTDFNNHKSSN